jgi:hypothetical protein
MNRRSKAGVAGLSVVMVTTVTATVVLADVASAMDSRSSSSRSRTSRPSSHESLFQDFLRQEGLAPRRGSTDTLPLYRANAANDPHTAPPAPDYPSESELAHQQRIRAERAERELESLRAQVNRADRRANASDEQGTSANQALNELSARIEARRRAREQERAEREQRTAAQAEHIRQMMEPVRFNTVSNVSLLPDKLLNGYGHGLTGVTRHAVGNSKWKDDIVKEGFSRPRNVILDRLDTLRFDDSGYDTPTAKPFIGDYQENLKSVRDRLKADPQFRPGADVHLIMTRMGITGKQAVTYTIFRKNQNGEVTLEKRPDGQLRGGLTNGPDVLGESVYLAALKRTGPVLYDLKRLDPAIRN